jgi:hypothetical protein
MPRLSLDKTILSVKPPQNSERMEVCSLTMPLVLAIVIAVAMAAVGFVAGIAYRKKVAEREITSAEEEAKRIVNVDFQMFHYLFFYCFERTSLMFSHND